ncbi:MAG: hypothetical protein NVSMB6_09960 [Burkholderiaceae bacterium]
MPYQYDEIHTFRAMSARRLDWLNATVVEEGISLQNAHGTDFAASYLKSKKIDFEIALRVLANPRARRRYTLQ